MKERLEEIFEGLSVYYEKEFLDEFDPDNYKEEIKTGKFGLAYYESDDLKYQFRVVLDINDQVVLYYLNDTLYDFSSYREMDGTEDDAIELMLSDLRLCDYNDYLRQIFDSDALIRQFGLDWDDEVSTLIKVK